MNFKIIVLSFILMASPSLAEQSKAFVGEVMNPCGDPIKFTQEEVEISAILNPSGAKEELLFNGHRYPTGFFYFYSQSNGDREHAFWIELKEAVKAIADSEGISIEEKCKKNGGE